MQDQKQYDHEAKRELHRLLNDALPPGDLPLTAFGPWAGTIESLREIHPLGTAAVRRVFLGLIPFEPQLQRLFWGEPPPRRTTWDHADLLHAEFPEPDWLLPGILPRGFATLVGRRRAGKSSLALQIALAVAEGGRVLGRPVERHTVLYVALEHGEPSIREWIAAHRPHPPADLHVVEDWPLRRAARAGRAQPPLEFKRYGLVIVDTLTRALGSPDTVDPTATAIALGRLRTLACWSGTAILAVDHHTTSASLGYADPIDDLLHTTGRARFVDAAIALYRARGKHEWALKAIGPDMSDLELVVDWDPAAHTWHVIRAAGEVRAGTAQAAVLHAIRQLAEAGRITSTTNIARHLSISKGTVSRALAELVRHGHVVRGRPYGRVVPYRLRDDARGPA